MCNYYAFAGACYIAILAVPKTLRLLSSFPASASSKVVFPHPGGPSSSVILHEE